MVNTWFSHYMETPLVPHLIPMPQVKAENFSKKEAEAQQHCDPWSEVVSSCGECLSSGTMLRVMTQHWVSKF